MKTNNTDIIFNSVRLAPSNPKKWVDRLESGNFSFEQAQQILKICESCLNNKFFKTTLKNRLITALVRNQPICALLKKRTALDDETKSLCWQSYLKAKEQMDSLSEKAAACAFWRFAEAVVHDPWQKLCEEPNYENWQRALKIEKEFASFNEAEMREEQKKFDALIAGNNPETPVESLLKNNQFEKAADLLREKSPLFKVRFFDSRPHFFKIAVEKNCAPLAREALAALEPALPYSASERGRMEKLCKKTLESCRLSPLFYKELTREFWLKHALEAILDKDKLCFENPPPSKLPAAVEEKLPPRNEYLEACFKERRRLNKQSLRRRELLKKLSAFTHTGADLLSLVENSDLISQETGKLFSLCLKFLKDSSREQEEKERLLRALASNHLTRKFFKTEMEPSLEMRAFCRRQYSRLENIKPYLYDRLFQRGLRKLALLDNAKLTLLLDRLKYQKLINPLFNLRFLFFSQQLREDFFSNAPQRFALLDEAEKERVVKMLSSFAIANSCFQEAFQEDALLSSPLTSFVRAVVEDPWREFHSCPTYKNWKNAQRIEQLIHSAAINQDDLREFLRLIRQYEEKTFRAIKKQVCTLVTADRYGAAAALLKNKPDQFKVQLFYEEGGIFTEAVDAGSAVLAREGLTALNPGIPFIEKERERMQALAKNVLESYLLQPDFYKQLTKEAWLKFALEELFTPMFASPTEE